MVEVAAIIACLILGLLAVFQLTLIAGAPFGEYAWGGQHKILPKNLRIGSAISIILYVFFGFLLLNASHIITIISSSWQLSTASWLLTAYFFAGIILNGISRSKKERNVMTPVVTLLFICSLLVSLNI